MLDNNHVEFTFEIPGILAEEMEKNAKAAGFHDVGNYVIHLALEQIKSGVKHPQWLIDLANGPVEAQEEFVKNLIAERETQRGRYPMGEE